jgi:tetratricopeptide (TPR) repeat protein
MKDLIHEIHRRSLWQVLGIYLAGSWIALQVVEQLTEAAGLPDWVRPFSLVLLVLGFPVVMATAFVQEGMMGRARGAGHTPDDATATSVEKPDARPRAPTEEGSPDVPATVGAGHRLFTWRNALLGGVAAFALLGVGAGGFMAMRVLGIGPAGTLVAKGLLEERATIVLTDFEAADSTLARAATEAFRVDLSQSSLVRLAEPSFIRDALARMEAIGSHLTLERGRELAVREGLPAVIGGEINPVGTGFVLTAQLVSAGSGEVLASQRETASDDSEMIAAIDELSKNLRERIGESLITIRAETPLARVTTGDLEALRKYSQAVYALEVSGDEERGIGLLEEALALDPEFAMAWRKLGITFANRFQERSRQVEALTRAFEHRDRLTERERYLAMAAYYSDVTNENARSITAYENLLELNPNDDWALNNLGIKYNEARDFERGADLFEQALRVDSINLPPYFNLTVARMALGDFDGAWNTLERGASNVPGNPQIPQLSVLVAAGQGDREAALAYADELEREQGANPFWMGWVEDVRAAIATAQGRLGDARTHRAQVERRHVERGVISEALDAALSAAWTEVLTRHDPAAGERVLDAALARYPLTDIPDLDRPYEQLVMLLSLASRPDRAREVLAEFESVVAEELRSPRGYERAQATLALAEGRYDDAIEGYRNTDDGICLSCSITGLALAHDRTGLADSAIVAYESYLDRPWPGRVYFDQDWLPATLERLGQLYDAKGDPENAVKYYAMFVELWAEADEELQPRVRAAQTRLEEILAERG